MVPVVITTGKSSVAPIGAGRFEGTTKQGTTKGHGTPQRDTAFFRVRQFQYRCASFFVSVQSLPPRASLKTRRCLEMAVEKKAT